MTEYTMRLNAEIMGMDTIAFDDPNDYQIGEEISITLNSNLIIQGLPGSLTLGSGETISGTVVGKE